MPEPEYWVNDRTGEVHTHDCPRVKVIHSKSPWNPAKAQLTPGVRADQICLPAGLPLRRAPEVVETPTLGMVDVMLHQVELDKAAPYWAEPPHSTTLDDAEIWLLSLRDHLAAGYE